MVALSANGSPITSTTQEGTHHGSLPASCSRPVTEDNRDHGSQRRHRRRCGPRFARPATPLWFVGRSPAKTRQVARELDSDHFVVDFARLAEVRHLAAEIDKTYPRIDVLANNAGGVFDRQHRTVDENDTSFSGIRAYGDAKLANILFTTELHTRFHDQGLSSAAFHPGTIASNFASNTAGTTGILYNTRLLRGLLTSVTKGAEQLVWLARSTPGVDWQSGVYYEKGKPARRSHGQVNNATLARELWDRSAALVGL